MAVKTVNRNEGTPTTATG